jgi:poly-beta-hydroxybutyrate-responsive repressor
MGECDPRNFLQPCLLLLLGERPDHGYDLANRLRELHVAEGDPGAVYRALRSLERQGLVRSTWQTSGTGPARRSYRLTQAGVESLERQAELLEATHDVLHVFRARFRRLKEASGVDAGERNGAHNGHCSIDPRGLRAAPRFGERPCG